MFDHFVWSVLVVPLLFLAVTHPLADRLRPDLAARVFAWSTVAIGAAAAITLVSFALKALAELPAVARFGGWSYRAVLADTAHVPWVSWVSLVWCVGVGDPGYDKELPQRRRDVDRAKKLLAEAGFDTGQTYQLFTKDEATGEVDSAKLFASQVRDAGVQIEVVPQDANVFYDQTWLKAPLYTANWGTNDSVIFFASKTMFSGTKWNESGFHDSAFDAAYLRALSAQDDAAYAEASREIQRIEYDRGGYLVWGVADGVDVASARVRDLPRLGGYGRVQLEKVWLA